MKTTALKDIQVEEVTYTKDDNRINVQHCDGVYSISTTNWEFKSFDEFIALFDCFKHKVEQPKFEEKIVGPTAEDIAARTAKKVEKKVRKDQFAKRWTPEQKKDITERYANGEGPSSIAKDYNVTPNTIHQICIRAGVKRGKVDPVISEALRKIDEASSRKKTDTAYTEKFETPAEQEEREKKQKKALKEFRESQDLPWYLRDSKSKKD